MLNIIRTEFIKERRGANYKLIFIVPLIFVVFNLLMISLMGKSPEGRSYLMATAFNWYPLTILPAVISLLLMNINSKEKEEHIAFQRRLNISGEKIIIAKAFLIILELLAILIISSVMIFFLGRLILDEKILLGDLIAATSCLFIGSFPIISISFLIYSLVKKKFLILLINFIMTILSPLFAVNAKWIFYPWSYSLRILSSVLFIHPNGTFIEESNFLTDPSNIYLGLILSVITGFIILIISLFIERRRSNV